MKKSVTNRLFGEKIARNTRRVNLIVLCLALTLSGLIPFLVPSNAGAAQITSRSLSISSGIPAATNVIYSYAFSLPTNGNVQSIQFQACTVAVGTCGTVTGININQGTQQGTNGFTSTTAFTRDAVGGGSCTPGNQVLCVKRTQATAETGAKTLAWNTQTNPSTANSTFYIRITTYSDTGWTTAVDTGTVASAVVQSLTVNAAVAEILSFCVGSTTVNDATTSVGADCSAVTGTSLNIGTLDTTTVNTSPVSSNGGDNKNGVAMLRTNAASGATVSYTAIQAGSGSNHLGTLRITGANCNAGNVNTDGCIDAQGATQGTFTAGTEKFGMTIGGTNCGSTTAYTCNYTTPTNHLAPSSNYIGAASNTYGVTNGFAWVETSGTQTTIASSSQPVDDEALILRFAATPSITTPFGSYSVASDYVAVATY